MNKILAQIEKTFMPVMAKLAENTYLKAIRNGMVCIIPLTIIGSFFLIALNIPLPGYAEWIAPYSDKIVIPFRMTVYMMSIYATFGIGSSLGKERGLDPTTSGVLALVGFMMTIIPVTGLVVDPTLAADGTISEVAASGWYMPFQYIGSAGLFGSIVISIFSVETLYIMKKKNMTIKMPEQVPQSVADSFAALAPTAVVILVLWFITVIVGFNIHNFFNVLLSPLQNFLAGENIFGALFTVLLITVLWSAGIHGVSIVGGLLRPFWQIALEANASQIAAGVDPSQLSNITPEPFFQWFVWIGGAGGTLGLLIAALIFAKSKQVRTITKLSFVPGLFNINEPVIFGFPIVMNPTLVIPFIFGPLVVTTISFYAIKFGFVTAPYLLAPWTLPAPIGAVMSTADFSALILALINLVILTIIYIPFVRMYDKECLKQEGALDA